MLIRSLGIPLAALGLITSFAACHRSAQPDVNRVAPVDSIVGTVSVTGTSFEQSITLQTDNGSVRLVPSRSDSAALVRVSKTTVVAYGTRADRSFRVDKFFVRSVDFRPVQDGVLRAEGNGIVLETAEGRFRLGNPPPALHGLIGARVWIGGSLDAGPNPYGIIVPAPPR